jgi:hypothetical protein
VLSERRIGTMLGLTRRNGMAGKKATAADGELILKLYDLRREAVMRQAREDVFSKFMPKSFEEFRATTKRDHPLNTAYRMVSSYWEMAAGLVKHGSLHLELFSENCGEGLFLFAKVQPFLSELRQEVAPTAFANMEWVVKRSKEAAHRLEGVKKRLAAMAK